MTTPTRVKNPNLYCAGLTRGSRPLRLECDRDGGQASLRGRRYRSREPTVFLSPGAISRCRRPGRLSSEMSADTAWTIYESPIGPLSVIPGPLGIRGGHFP